MSVDELLPPARELAQKEGRIPSKNALAKALNIRWPRAVEVFQALTAEAARERAERAAKRAAIAARRRAGKGPGHQSSRRRVHLRHLPADRTADLAGKRPDATVSIPSPAHRRPVRSWPLVLLAAPAFVAIWSGWVDLGRLTGFGVVHPFPGILDEVALNTAITLPVGLETYAAYALYVWLSGAVPPVARRFAKWSAIGSLALGAAGQVAYHLMVAAGMTSAPWQITTVVACLPVSVLGIGAALYHLVRAGEKP